MKDRKKVQHIHSSIADKQPTAQSLEVGEIAVNNAANKEFLSLKNTDDKVVRFSSDEQLITWIEKKEVIPYSACTRGSSGGTGGPDSVTNDDLLQNKSNIVVLFNQVAANNTPHKGDINDAKDIYNREVNPNHDGTLPYGAGLAIDMSRYAMIGANPSFSSLTVTDKTDLSGNTTISNGDGSGTRTGHTLTISTTDVTANDTNWTETITNRTSTVTNETDKITTLNESATTRTTVIGTENLTVSGTTTEIKNGDVKETNNSKTSIDRIGDVSVNNRANVTEVTSGNSNVTISGASKVQVSGSTTADTKGNVTITTSGTTSIDRQDNVSENNQNSVTVVTSGDSTTTVSGNVVSNTSGDTSVKTVGTTTLDSTGTTTIQSTGSGSDVLIYAKDNLTATATTITATSSSDTDLNVGRNLTEKVTGNTNVTVSGSTTIKSEDGTTIQTTSGNTNINTTGNTNITSTVNATIDTTGNTTATSTGDTTIQSNGANKSVTVQSTGSGGDVNVYANDVLTETANTIVVNATTSISAKTPTTYVSGTTLEVKENSINLSAATGTNISGGTFTSTSTGDTTLNASGNTNINTSGSTTITTTGNTTIQSTASGSNVNIYAGSAGATNITAQTINQNSTSAITKTSSAYSSANTAVTVVGTADTTITSAKTVVTTSNVSATTATLSGNTLDVKEANGLTYSGGTLNSTTTGNTTIQATDGTAGDINIYAGDSLTESGKTVTINGSSSITETSPATTIVGSTTLNLSGATVTESGSTKVVVTSPTTEITGSTSLNLRGATVGISGGTTNISGGTLTISGGTITYYRNPTASLSSTTVNGALDEAMGRSTVTMERDDNPSSSGLSAVYRLYQNGLQIGYDINVPKDGFLKNVELVNVDNTYYLRFTWNIFDADTQTYSTGSTDVNVEDLVKDIDDKNPSDVGTANDHNVSVDVHYDSTDKKMVVSASTSSNMHVSGSITVPSITATNITVNDKVTAVNGFFQTSDARYKKNVSDVDLDKATQASNVRIKQFNYIDDPSDRLVYGIIAQEAEEHKLNEIVYTDENGKKSVDYTSLLLLKIAHLEKEVEVLRNGLTDLDGKLTKLMNKSKD